LFTVSGGGSVSLRPQGGNVYDIEYTFEGENWNTNGGAAMTLTYGTWYHCAIVRYSTGPVTNIFFNGNRQSNRTATHTWPFTNGTSVDLLVNGGQNLVYLDEIRLSNTAKYANAATYTIPTEPFINSSSTKLLMHFNGSPGGTVFEDDNSPAPTTVSFQDSATSIASTITVPGSAAVGDVAILFDTSTTVTNTIPSGWTSISGVTTTGIRQNISYKLIGSSDIGATVTGMAGTTRKVMLVYRGNALIGEVTPTVTGTQATTATPTAQSLVGQAGPMIAFATYSATSTITTRGWSVGSPSEYSSVSGSGIYVKALITNSGTPSTTSITMTDSGTNAMQSFRLKIG